MAKKGGTKKKTQAAGAAERGQSAVRLWVRRSRAAGALTGFVVATWVAHGAGLGLTDAALRGLLGAIGFSVVAWWCALMVITGLLRTAAHRRNEQAAPAGQIAQSAPAEASAHGEGTP